MKYEGYSNLIHRGLHLFTMIDQYSAQSTNVCGKKNNLVFLAETDVAWVVISSGWGGTLQLKGAKLSCLPSVGMGIGVRSAHKLWLVHASAKYVSILFYTGL